MKLPPIRIGSYLFRREYRKRMERAPNGMERDGWCKPAEQVILVRAGMSPDRDRVVWLHEILHAIWWDKDLPDDEELEEQIVVALSEGLCAAYPDFRP